MRCVICDLEKDGSKEHIIPEAMGNSKLITYKVCEECNNKLGSKVDKYLTDYIITKIIRKNLEVQKNMARIAGVDLPKEKRVEIGLTYIYGIGLTSSQKILAKAGINPDTRVKDLTDDEVNSIRKVIDESYKVEGDLRREVALNIKRLTEIGCYRGLRHRKGLPVRGQRTKTNARTRKGPRKLVSKSKK